ncbi:MAG: GTP-binding protein [Promethearchaeota archaeon]|nr:MAG: GTP-binding protein [Candidatus Lokiarchaeota archaeon]
MTPYIPDEKNVSYSFKIVIIGAPGVGKTCLFNRYCFNSFDMNTDMTIGINFHSTFLRVQVKDGNENETFVANSIFDFGGQARFKSLIPKFIDGANGALMLFDSIDFSSFQQLDFWYDKLVENAKKSIPKFLIGSKSDLLDKSPAQIVNEDLIEDYVKEKQLDGFFRTSALENYNVLEVFKELTNLMLKRHKIEAFVI